MEWWSLMAARPAVGASSDTIPSQCVPLWAWASAGTFHQAMVMSVGGRPHSWLGKYGHPVGHRRAQSVPQHTICFYGLCGNMRQQHKNVPNAQSVPYYNKPFRKALSWGRVEDLDTQRTWTCPKFLNGSGNPKVIKQNSIKCLDPFLFIASPTIKAMDATVWNWTNLTSKSEKKKFTLCRTVFAECWSCTHQNLSAVTLHSFVWIPICTQLKSSSSYS